MRFSLTLILDRELPDPFGFSGDSDFNETSLYLISDNSIFPVSINNMANYRRVTNEKIPKSMRESMYNESQIIAAFDEEIGKENRVKLLKGNSKLALNILLNSPGGHNVVLESILDIISLVKSNGGTVNSFSFISVASAASCIFSFTDDRYCLKLSEFMCHAAASIPELESVNENQSDEEKEISETLNRKEYKEHLEQFFKKHHHEKTKRIKKIIDLAIDKHDCDLSLGGYNLEDLGVVERAFYDFKEYRKFIMKKIGDAIFKHERFIPFIDNMQKEYNLVLDDNTKYTQKLPVLKCPKNGE